jgi:ABC-type sugar transport system ATPase subunit
VRRLSKHGGFQAVDFAVRRGEVVGIAGLMGAGRTALVNALYGLAPADAGDILVAGQPVRVRCPRDALNHGIALVSEDRQLYGLVLKLSVKHNLTLHDLCRCCRGPFILPQQEDRLTDQCLDTFAIRAASRDQAVKYLSGGNQQKLVLAKALLTEPDILLLDEPTRGIDIGAKAEIYALIHRLAQAGKAIVLVSSELPEILALSHRLLVMCQGRITAELDPRRASPDDILRHAMP